MRMVETALGLQGPRLSHHHRDSRMRIARPGSVMIEHPTVYQTSMKSGSCEGQSKTNAPQAADEKPAATAVGRGTA
jgi:hypothetical protein